jgi:hypothetical protein
MRQGGEGETAGIAHVGGEVTAGHLAKRGNEIEEPDVRTPLEQDPVPVVLEVESGCDVPAGLLDAPIHLGHAVQLLRGRFGRKPQGQGLERAEDGAHLADLVGVEGSDPEAAAHRALEDPVTGQAEQRFADGRATDAKLGGEIGIAKPGTGWDLPALDAVEELAADLVAEWDAGYHAILEMNGIRNSVYNISISIAGNTRTEIHHMVRPLLLLALLSPTLGAAQSEAALRDYFEGRTVNLKIAMPGTENGVDLYPGTAKPLDYPRHASRLKDYGTALTPGDPALVTKVKVKSKLIEFQLDGGGYGTSGDETSSNISVGSTPKTKREQNLEGELKRETDPVKRRAIKEELDDLKAAREREDARNRAAVAEAEESRQANIRQRRLEGGSRFNIRYKNGVPASALMPDTVKQALSAYLEFPEPAPDPEPVPMSGNLPAPGQPGALPSKGMLAADVDRQFGAPKSSSERAEGNLSVTTRVYDTEAGTVTAEFVEGVLIRYTVVSR